LSNYPGLLPAPVFIETNTAPLIGFTGFAHGGNKERCTRQLIRQHIAQVDKKLYFF
jgi:hypothetical protein